MEVNALFIKTKRTDKAWTQQHLADASGLSLRTIQRVERDGSASNETVLALCAVFEVSKEQLSIIPQVTEEKSKSETAIDYRYLMLVALVLGVLLGMSAMYFFLRFGK